MVEPAVSHTNVRPPKVVCVSSPSFLLFWFSFVVLIFFLFRQATQRKIYVTARPFPGLVDEVIRETLASCRDRLSVSLSSPSH
jgi:hypothetical protein